MRVQRLGRGSDYRNPWFGEYLRIFILVAALTRLTFVALASSNPAIWYAYAFLFMLSAGGICWGLSKDRRKWRLAFDTANGRQPEFFTLDNRGLNLKSPDGNTTLVPWSSFKGWRELSSIILLPAAEPDKPAVILPLSQLSPTERDLLRGTLQSHLGAAAS
jgi:hypothetical protein